MDLEVLLHQPCLTRFNTTYTLESSVRITLSYWEREEADMYCPASSHYLFRKVIHALTSIYR